MNWGYKIMFLFVGFVGLVLTMVYLAFQHDVDLVAEDYYQQEIRYQDEIDRLTNARALRNPIIIEYRINEKMVEIQYPHDSGSIVSGEVVFFRPSEKKMDMVLPVKVKENMTQAISVGGFQKGYWKVKVYWEVSDSSYLEEKEIIIQ